MDSDYLIHQRLEMWLDGAINQPNNALNRKQARAGMASHKFTILESCSGSSVSAGTRHLHKVCRDNPLPQLHTKEPEA